jgi:hypothetical protein
MLHSSLSEPFFTQFFSGKGVPLRLVVACIRRLHGLYFWTLFFLTHFFTRLFLRYF